MTRAPHPPRLAPAAARCAAPRPAESRAASRAASPSAAARALRAALAAGPLALLAACATPPGTTLVHSPLIDARYTPNQVGAFGPSMPVRIVGAPPDGAAAQEAAAPLRLPQRFGGQPLSLAETPGEDPRIVIAFKPVSRRDLCSDPQGGSGPGRDGALEAGLAYCWGGDAVSSVLMSSRATAGPRDAGYAGAMRKALSRLLPARDPKDDGLDADPTLPGG